MASADSALALRLDEVGEADPALFTAAAPSFIDTWPIRLAIVRARAALMSMRLDDASKAISKLNRLLSTCSRSHFLRYSPSLRILRAFRLAAADDVEGARSLLVALPSPAANTLAATILWYADWRRGDCEVYAADTLDYLDVPVGGKAVDRIYNLCMSAALAFERLHLTVSASLASEALDLARRRYGSHSPLSCLPATLLAQVAYEQGRLEEAEALLRPRISVIRAAGIPECVLRASVLLARIALHRGHARCALAALRDAEAVGRARRWPRLLSIASAEYARTLQAVRCCEDGIHEFRASPKRDHPGAGRDGRTLTSPPNAPVRFSSVEGALRRACATAADGRIDDSDKLLIQCLRTGAVHGLRMIFPDVGPQIFPLLESVYHTIPPNDLQLADLRPYIASILKSKPRRKTEEPAPSTYRSLSRREAGVLQMIARGMSNKRIAQSLGIAPETVKTHAKGILSKLETRTRAQAVARAEAIGLF